MSKKIVVKLDLHDNKDKQKAIKAVSVLVGIDAISVDMASRKMTVFGTVDPVNVVSKLRKTWAAQLDSVGPAKEPEKKEEKKEGGDGAKKEGGGEGKKEEGSGDGKKDGDGKEGDGKKEGDAAKKDGGDGKEEEGGGDNGKKEDGGDKKEGDAKKEGGGGERKVLLPPSMPLHHLPPHYMNMITADYMNQYRPMPPQPYPYAPPPQQYYYVRNMSMEENPNSCAIC